MGRRHGGPRTQQNSRSGARNARRTPERSAARMDSAPFKRGRIACSKRTNMEVLQPLPAGGDAMDADEPAAVATAPRDRSLKQFMRELRKVLEHADVLLEVLDVRDPLGCRAYSLEREAVQQGKRVILVLNKVDLVPASNTRAWLTYLRHEFPTLPFKASTQQQRSHLSQGGMLAARASDPSAALATGAEAAGANEILQLIKNYSRNLNLKTSITVGIVGAPNVGKSSLINSLKRSRVCGVAATPGHTKVVQGVMLDRHVRLLDCPGIVFADAAAPPGASAEVAQAARQAALLRNVLKAELVEDPMEPVQAILARVSPACLADVYKIPENACMDVQDFLLRVAFQKGRLARGAVPDLEGTARSVLHDWNSGKIRYHTEPPTRPARRADDAPAAAPGQDAILTGYSEAFDLGGLLGEADNRVLGGATVASAEMEDDEPATAGEPAAPPAPDPADSSLGKRARDGSEDESEEEDSVPWRAAPPSRGNAFSLLATDDAEEEPEPEPAPKAPARPAGQSDRQLFSAEELEGMALSRGAARRKARKESKKRRREGELTGAVNTLMELGAEGEEDPMDKWDAGDAWDAPSVIDGAADAAADNNPILDPASLKATAPPPLTAGAPLAPDAVHESDEEL